MLLAEVAPKSPSCSPAIAAEQTLPVRQVLPPRTSWSPVQHPSAASYMFHLQLSAFLRAGPAVPGGYGVSHCAGTTVLFASVPERSTERSAARACQRRPVPTPPAQKAAEHHRRSQLSPPCPQMTPAFPFPSPSDGLCSAGSGCSAVLGKKKDMLKERHKNLKE